MVCVVDRGRVNAALPVETQGSGVAGKTSPVEPGRRWISARSGASPPRAGKARLARGDGTEPLARLVPPASARPGGPAQRRLPGGARGPPPEGAPLERDEHRTSVRDREKDLERPRIAPLRDPSQHMRHLEEPAVLLRGPLRRWRGLQVPHERIHLGRTGEPHEEPHDVVASRESRSRRSAGSAPTPSGPISRSAISGVIPSK